MRLKVLLPNEIFINETVQKVIAEAENGLFCLLPRHIDFVAALVPGILAFVSEGGNEEFLAIDEGILVKNGGDVFVSTWHAVRGRDLGELRMTVEESFRHLNEHEQQARVALNKLEADLVRRFIDLENPRHV